jgi:hypothetical protein
MRKALLMGVSGMVSCLEVVVSGPFPSNGHLTMLTKIVYTTVRVFVPALLYGKGAQKSPKWSCMKTYVVKMLRLSFITCIAYRTPPTFSWWWRNYQVVLQDPVNLLSEDCHAGQSEYINH